MSETSFVICFFLLIILYILPTLIALKANKKKHLSHLYFEPIARLDSIRMDRYTNMGSSIRA